MIVFIDYNSNYIRIVPVKSRKSEHLVEAHKTTCDWHKARGFEAEPLRLDNETSKLMTQAINCVRPQTALLLAACALPILCGECHVGDGALYPR